jgi:hypothetical protein
MAVQNIDRANQMVAMRLEGKTLEEIGKEYGLTRARVCQIVGKSQTGKQMMSSAKRDRTQKMIALRDEGKTQLEIASLFGISNSQVCRITGGEKRNMVKHFWERYRVADNGCWEWIGAKTCGGYGRVMFEGKFSLAHRVAWILTNGPIPDGFMACHHCDNPGCINPDHLFLGDAGDNARDREHKNRNIKPIINLGGRSSKLTDHDVMTARRLYGRGAATVADLSRCLHVTYSNMYRIVTGRAWKHLSIQAGI